MARIKVKLQDQTPARVIFLDPDATVGADIGTDLRYNGTVQTLAQLRALFASSTTGSSSSGSGTTAHRLLLGLAVGDDHPQYTRRDTLTSDGDLYTRNAGAIVRLPIGSAGQALRVSSGLPTWQSGSALTKTDDTNVTLTLGGAPTTALLGATSLTLGWTGTLAPARGGTNISTYATGDTLYASAANVLSKLAIGSTGNVLTVAGGVPTWAPLSVPVGANPSASVGLTAVNGVATTFMRSDAAPALSQAIVPTWTGRHTFGGAVPTVTIGTTTVTGVITAPTPSSGANVSGRGLTIQATDSTALSGSGTGGALTLTAGSTTAPSGTGGSVTITAGIGGGTGTLSNGGSITIASGDGSPSATSTASGGGFTLTSGAGGSGNTCNGGPFSFTAGLSGSGLNGAGGGFFMAAGDSQATGATGTGGGFNLRGGGGSGFATSGVGGSVAIAAGDGAGTVTSTGGAVTITSGSSFTASNGGDITLRTGDAYNSGLSGNLVLGTGYADAGVFGEIRLRINDVTKLVVDSDGRFSGTALHNNSASVAGTAKQYIASGTYTPTLTGIANVSASTARVCQWLRVGNVVTVSGAFSVTPTLGVSTATGIDLSLPIASALTQSYQLGGAGMQAGISTQGGSFRANATNDRAAYEFQSLTTAAAEHYFAFTYQVL